MGAMLPWKALIEGRWLGDMVRRHDERAFDTCLTLLRFPPGQITLNYHEVAAVLGMAGMSREGYRRQINKTLGKLQDGYGLLQVNLQRGQDAVVELDAGLRSVGGDSGVRIPDVYWEYGWNHVLGFPGKVMLLMNLAYGGAGSSAREWSEAGPTLAKRHHLTKDFLSKGTTELRRWNLLDVARH